MHSLILKVLSPQCQELDLQEKCFGGQLEEYTGDEANKSLSGLGFQQGFFFMLSMPEEKQGTQTIRQMNLDFTVIIYVFSHVSGTVMAYCSVDQPHWTEISQQIWYNHTCPPLDEFLNCGDLVTNCLVPSSEQNF